MHIPVVTQAVGNLSSSLYLMMMCLRSPNMALRLLHKLVALVPLQLHQVRFRLGLPRQVLLKQKVADCLRDHPPGQMEAVLFECHLKMGIIINDSSSSSSPQRHRIQLEWTNLRILIPIRPIIIPINSRRFLSNKLDPVLSSHRRRRTI